MLTDNYSVNWSVNPPKTVKWWIADSLKTQILSNTENQGKRVLVINNSMLSGFSHAQYVRLDSIGD